MQLDEKKLKKMIGRLFDQEGDAIEGEQVIAQARKIGKTIVIPGTSNHKIQQITLKRNVLCVIDRSLRLKKGPMSLTTSVKKLKP